MEPRPAPKRRPQLIVEIAPDKMGDAIFSSAPSEVQTPPAKR